MGVYTYVFWDQESILDGAFTPKCSWNELWPHPYLTVGKFLTFSNWTMMGTFSCAFDTRNQLPMLFLSQNIQVHYTACLGDNIKLFLAC